MDIMIVDTYRKQLLILVELGYKLPSEYICPFCLRTIQDNNLISLEDAPQDSLGGSKIALTCKECNNKYGETIDCHLVNYITDREDGKFPVGMNRPFVFHDKKSGVDVQGQIEIGANGEMSMILPEKVNNPKKLAATIKDLQIGDIVDAEMRVNLNKRIPRNIAAAHIKNAYVILFSYFGYSFLLDPFYDSFREQMNKPEDEIITEGLISQEGVFNSYEDGVYVCDNTPLRGFFVVFTLIKRGNHKYGVFIPAIVNGIEPAISAARSIKKGDGIRAFKIEKNPKFWDSKETIRKVIEWSHDDNISWKEVAAV